MRQRLVILVLAWTVTAHAESVHVPGDYATIQAALDAIAEGDTVLVGLGTYGEALVAPPFSFVLKGDVVQDTGDYPRPIIDPTPLPSPTTQCCLRIQDGHPVVEDIRFRNGPAMQHDRPWELAGGIDTDEGTALTVRRSVFDHVWCAIGSGSIPLTLEDCYFLNDTTWCINNAVAAVRAYHCTFASPGSWNIELIRAGDSSEFVDCRFRDAFERCSYITMPASSYFRIAGCIFGPGAPQDPMMLIDGVHRAYIEDNLFTDLQFEGAGNILRIGTDLEDTLFICRNRFLRNREGWALQIGTDTTHGFCAVVDSNVFADGVATSTSLVAKALIIGKRIIARGNHFVRLTGPASVIALDHDSLSELRNNLFERNGRAVFTEYRSDGRWNWWGDPSGPYETVGNSTGRGDTVNAALMYDPWCRDTTFVSTADEWEASLPYTLALTVSPNPFNSETRISYEVERIGKVTLAVYDLQGRLVRTLCDEVKAAGRHEVLFEGEGLSSGTYFVRLEAGGEKRVQKVMLLK